MRNPASLAVAAGVLALGGWSLVRAAPGLSRIVLQLKGGFVPASSAILSEHEREEISAMSPQDQAMRLLERTINHYAGAGEEISERVDRWTGQIQTSPDLEKLTNTAYFSSDLRVRAAALEIWLARDNVRKTPEELNELIHQASVTPDRKYYYLSTVGILGNRGVEPEKVLSTLTLYIRDPDPEARSGAINGLALLGTAETVAPLLEAFHNDSSHDLRERAACNLADSGMLTRELRQTAVPELVRFSQDPNLDATTKKWVYQALREITLQNLPNEPTAWVSWYGSHSAR